MKVLDGSTGEGGGQILRTALFLSTLTQEPFRMEHIRRGRTKPGLKAQHAGILQLLHEVTGSHATGVSVGSTTVEFQPGRPRPGNYRFDVGTAGCLPLFLQTLLPVCLIAPGPVRLELVGGTDVRGGPTIDWIQHVLQPVLGPVARRVDVSCQRRGFEPAGGGRVLLDVTPHPAASTLEGLRQIVGEALRATSGRRGPLKAFEGTSVAQESLKAANVAERQRAGVEAAFRTAGLPAPAMREEYAAASSVGTSVTLFASDERGHILGADALGARGTPAEDVGRRAALQLLEDIQTGAGTDRHLADHLVPWVALGMGAVEVPQRTGHLETNVWTCQQFLGKDSVRLDGVVLQSHPSSKG